MRRLARGYYLNAEDLHSPLRRTIALAQSLPPHAVVSHRSAALLRGIDVLPPDHRRHSWPVEITVPPDRSKPRVPGVTARQAPLPETDLTRIDGIVVTTLLRTAVDCARYLPWYQAVAALDQFLRQGVSPQDLWWRAEKLQGQRGAKQLRDALHTADPGAQLPGETFLRLRVIDAELPRPRTQVPVPLPDGRVAFLDLGHEEYRVGLEYDGAEHHTKLEDLQHDHARRRRIRNQGWHLIVVRAYSVFACPEPFLRAYHQALWERGWRPGPAARARARHGLRRAHYPRPI